jgi:hypothetical protein
LIIAITATPGIAAVFTRLIPSHVSSFGYKISTAPYHRGRNSVFQRFW